MAKKECPSCAMEIDDKAQTCPICSYEFPKTSNWIVITAVILVLLFLYLIIS